MAKFILKLYLLIWKNALLLKRHYLKTTFQILVPVLVLSMFYYLSNNQQWKDARKRPSEQDPDAPTTRGPRHQGPRNQGPPRQGPPQHQRAADELADQHSRNESHLPFPKISNVYYSPSNSFTDKLMQDVQQKTNINITAVSSASALEDAMIGVLFLNDEDTKNLNYRFRSRLGLEKALDIFGSDLLSLQEAIDWSFIDSVRPMSAPDVNSSLQKYTQISTQAFSFNGDYVSQYFLLSLIIMCLDVVGKIVEEKQSGATELLKLMGLSRGMIWLTWFIQSMLISLIIMTLCAIILKDATTEHSDLLLIWVFLMLSSVAMVVSWFMVSTLFSRAWLAMLMSLIMWIALSSIPPVIAILEEISFSWKMASCIFPSLGVYWGMQALYQYEKFDMGISFSNFETTPAINKPNDIAMADVFVMLFVDIIFYGILTWYIDAIYPGKYGIPQPAYFPFTKSYWCGSKQPFQTFGNEDKLETQNFETAPDNLVAGIRIVNLSKTFKKKRAVAGVSFDIYQDQITVLLGHNGAGKTTTMSIMTGMIPATSGSVWINGHNISTNLAKARESLGLCPQHDLLFNDLTVKEHLIFIAMLKGLSHSQAKLAAADLLQKLHMSEKANVRAKTLSGGMKRRVCLGLALVGGSKVVILDEPTSGLDPEARRQVWDVLLALRGECTILITTHFMEEADVLGERIAIMDHGRVKCYGTSLYLKNKYGSGYKLKLLTKPGYNIVTISQFVQSRIGGAKLKSQLGSELDFTLPLESKPQFAALFKALESSKSTLHIDSIGVSITTLEDVFIQVGREASGIVDEPATVVEVEPQDTRATKPHVKGILLLVQQTGALFIKKMLYTLRHWLATLVYALLTVVLMSVAMYLCIAILNLGASMSEKKTSLLFFTGDNSSILARAESAGSYPEAVAPDVGVSEALLRLRIADLAPHDKLSAAQSDPISINLVNNAILKTYAGEDYSIAVANQTLDSRKKSYTQKFDFQEDSSTKSGIQKYQGFVVFLFGFMTSLGLMFLTSSFMTLPLEERVSGSKHLQRMTGVGPIHYWLTCFLWDFLIYLLVAAMLLAVLIAVDTKSYFGHDREAKVFMVLLVMYGLAEIPLAYLFSYSSSSYPKSLGVFMGVNAAFCILAVVMHSLFMVNTIEDERILKAFYFLPQYNIYLAFTSFIAQALTAYVCAETPGCEDKLNPDYLEFHDGIGMNILLLGIDGIIFMVVIMIIDYQVFPLLISKMSRGRWDQNEDQLDDDVREEISRVHEAPDDAYALTVRDLKKKYRSHLAVKGVTFGVTAGQCFGLLGFNGAGKTTTFKMLTGTDIPMHGDAFIRSTSLRRNQSKFMSQIGYCPQYDGINEYMTCREVLKIYALLRGVHRSDVTWTVNTWLKRMGLEEYRKVQCGKYSGGNKRKLSTAMALIGDPPLVFLDEPTTGVDPVARRNLWNVLSQVNQSGDRAIVLTTHSMEECEALASRLAVMVLGQFVCIGESQYLKKKFCQGFTVFIKLTDPPIDENQVETVKSAFVKLFNKCELKAERRGMLHYILTDKDLLWDQMFTNMEYLKDNQKGVQDYTVGETTLEQVFLSFAKK